jgi:hypothetical protein
MRHLALSEQRLKIMFLFMKNCTLNAETACASGSAGWLRCHRVNPAGKLFGAFFDGLVQGEMY